MVRALAPVLAVVVLAVAAGVLLARYGVPVASHDGGLGISAASSSGSGGCCPGSKSSDVALASTDQAEHAHKDHSAKDCGGCPSKAQMASTSTEGSECSSGGCPYTAVSADKQCGSEGKADCSKSCAKECSGKDEAACCSESSKGECCDSDAPGEEAPSADQPKLATSEELIADFLPAFDAMELFRNSRNIMAPL